MIGFCHRQLPTREPFSVVWWGYVVEGALGLILLLFSGWYEAFGVRVGVDVVLVIKLRLRVPGHSLVRHFPNQIKIRLCRLSLKIIITRNLWRASIHNLHPIHLHIKLLPLIPIRYRRLLIERSCPIMRFALIYPLMHLHLHFAKLALVRRIIELLFAENLFGLYRINFSWILSGLWLCWLKLYYLV